MKLTRCACLHCQTRKELVSGGFKDRHHDWGNLLLSLGVMTSVAGGMNTYIRVGKLFPGPHLFAGALLPLSPTMIASETPREGTALALSSCRPVGLVQHL